MSKTYPFWETESRGIIHSIYAEVRATDPIHRAIGPVSGNPIWFLTRYDDCVNFLKDNRFGKDVKRLPKEKSMRYGPGIDPNDPLTAVNAHLLNIDPPDHTRLRALVHKAFTPRMVENLRPRIQQIADELLNAMHGEVDLIASYAFPLPITVIAEMLGVPVSDQEKFKSWTKTLLFDTDLERSQMAAMEFINYMNNMMDERRASPQDDLLTALLNAEEAGDKLNHEELLSMIFLLLVAGHETTVNLIGNGMLALMQHPDQQAQLVAALDDDEAVKTAIDEMLRYNGPVETTTFRVAMEEVRISDMVIEQGDMVLAALLAANRDPAVFDNPDTFDITRTPNRHIAFGTGIHYCLGAPLARLEGQIAIPALLRHFPQIELNAAYDDLEWNPSLLLHGLKSLPVRVVAAKQ